MDSAPKNEATRLLLQWKGGDHNALNALMPLVESELRRLAAGYMRRERAGHTLQPTALVNEAWLRLSQQNQPPYECRSHFIAIAAQYMRQILVEHARRRSANKRGAGARPLGLDDAALFAPGKFAPEKSRDLIALDDGLKELSRLDDRQARIVELHFFGGLTYEEIAGFLKLGRSTIIRDLRMAQVWLRSYLAT